MRNFIFTITIILLFSVQVIFCCSLKIAPFSEFDSKEYIFIGKVIDYTEPKIIPKQYDPSLTPENKRKTYGLVVEIKQKIYLPDEPKKYFEIFDFQLGGACEYIAIDISELKSNFPIGSEIRVTAKKAKVFPDNVENGNVRIEVLGFSHLINNKNSEGKSLTTADSVFDYKTYEDEKSRENAFLPIFEIKKDIIRLSKSKRQEEKNEILNRIIYYPQNYIWFVDIEKILKDNSENSDNLVNKFEQYLKSIMTADQYTSYKYNVERGRKLRKKN